MGPEIERYEWARGVEAMLRFGPREGPIVVAVPALFEEANRTRALLTAVLRGLAARGIGGVLPDLPGQNDSLVATEDARLSDWRAAFATAVASLDAPAHVVAIRAGALIDLDADLVSRWYLSPLSGAAQVRELERLRQTGGGGDYAGNMIDPAMLAELDAAEPAILPPLRVARCSGDPRPADAIFTAPPPWRTSEPRVDPALVAAMVSDIAEWIASCAA
jgi:hypothetical protein